MRTLKKFHTAALITGALLVGDGVNAAYDPINDLLNLTLNDYTIDGDLYSKDSDPATPQAIANDLGTAYFTWDQQQPTGTGVLEPFVRIQQNGSEQGYNTTTSNSGQLPFQEKFGVWTHDVLISDLALTADGLFYEFVLDLGEPVSNTAVNGQNSLISLDGLRLLSATTGGQTNKGTLSNSTNGDWDWAASGYNQLLWDMDRDGTGDYVNNTILLDANREGNPGNGVSDMVMRVQKDVIERAEGDYFILWSRFGLTEDYDGAAGAKSFGTFEEWAYRSVSGDGGGGPPGGGVPIPAPLALIGLGAGLLGWKTRKARA